VVEPRTWGIKGRWHVGKNDEPSPKKGGGVEDIFKGNATSKKRKVFKGDPGGEHKKGKVLGGRGPKFPPGCIPRKL